MGHGTVGRRLIWIWAAATAMVLPVATVAIDRARPGVIEKPGAYRQGPTFAVTLALTAEQLGIGDHSFNTTAAGVVWSYLDREYPVEADWFLQDLGAPRVEWLRSPFSPALGARAVSTACAELGAVGIPLRAEASRLARQGGLSSRQAWTGLYLRACRARRQKRLVAARRLVPAMVFAKHFNMGGSHYAYTEAQSDGQDERHFYPGAALCVMRWGASGPIQETLLSDPTGVIRDPAVSYDGRRVLFAWKKSLDADDYHIYEMDLRTRAIRQVTRGVGAADYEPAYLPGGRIVFSSTRCVQTVDCWWTEVSNLYSVRLDGTGLRRLGYDQVHTNYPQVTADGRVTYTRWEYNDRGQIFVQSLFQMNPDGTGQRELYGNNSYFPTSLLHARAIPGSAKLLAVASGHHTLQNGQLVMVDPGKGRQENAGVELIAPRRPTPAERVDAYGQSGNQWAYPYPLDFRQFVTSFRPDDGYTRLRDYFDGRYSIYWMDVNGRREVLAADRDQSCHQAVPLVARPMPPARPSAHGNGPAVVHIRDVYAGAGMSGVARGSAARIRVVALGYRAAGIGNNGNQGMAGGALVCTPVGVSQAAWDTKTVLGEAAVLPDGSATFEVPPQTPVYFQVVDRNDRVIQTMRSWATFQPGEKAACVGCHESSQSPPPVGRAGAVLASPERLVAPYGTQGFSFARVVQPILDRHCVACHSDRSKLPPGRSLRTTVDLADLTPISDVGEEWSYTTERPAEGWQGTAFSAAGWRVGRAGFGTLPPTTRTTWDTTDIWARRTFTMPAGVATGRLFLRVFYDEDFEIYINGVLAASGTGFVTDFEQVPILRPGAAAIHAGGNALAVHCRQTLGGQGIEVGLYAGPPAPPTTGGSFSLLATTVHDVQAARNWSDAYLALTSATEYQPPESEHTAYIGHSSDLVNWVSPQSAPPVQSPYSAGSCRSLLMEMLEQGHGGVRLAREELAAIACWIDLAVPFCGDYREANAWTAEQVAKYDHFEAKREAMRRLEEK